jgi:hypothetical protein
VIYMLQSTGNNWKICQVCCFQALEQQTWTHDSCLVGCEATGGKKIKGKPKTLRDNCHRAILYIINLACKAVWMHLFPKFITSWDMTHILLLWTQLLLHWKETFQILIHLKCSI